MNFNDLVTEFPPVRTYCVMPGCYNAPLTGRIPIDYYNRHKDEIAQARRQYGKTKVMWRGPKAGGHDTSFVNATHAIVYAAAS